MGQTKKLYEEMELNEFLSHFFTHNESDEDYLYQEYREKQLDAERAAYEEMLGDR